MGRKKREIKRIENASNRQITFSKRRHGIMKKAHELSVLCDVDVAVIIFSQAGRVTHFSGNKGIEEIMARFVNMPEQERDGPSKEELLSKVMGNTKDQSVQKHLSVVSADSRLEDLQQELMQHKWELETMKKRLSMYEGDPNKHITKEAQHDKRIFKIPTHANQTVENMYDDQMVLSGPSHTQVNMYSQTMHLDGLVAKDGGKVLELSTQKDALQVLQQEEALNFLDCNGSTLLLPRGQPDHCEYMEGMIYPSLNSLMCGGNMQSEEQMNSHTGKGKDIMNSSNISQAQASTSYGQVDINISPWENQLLYQTGTDMLDQRELQELFLPRFTQ